MRGLLIVDDDIKLAAALAEYLRYEGFDAIAAHDGKEALEMLRHADPLPHAILVDLGTAGKTCPEMIKALGDEPKWAQIPVLVATAVPPEGQHDIEHASHVLQKPIEMRHLVKVLQQYCRRSA